MNQCKVEILGISVGWRSMTSIVLNWYLIFWVANNLLSDFCFSSSFFQIQLLLGVESAISVGWEKKDERMSAVGEIKVSLFFLFIVRKWLHRCTYLFWTSSEMSLIFSLFSFFVVFLLFMFCHWRLAQIPLGHQLIILVAFPKSLMAV